MSPQLALLLADRTDSSDSWCTSLALATDLGRFDMDPCSNPRSHIQAARTLSLENSDDGLTAPWVGSVFVNGPYSNPLPWCVRLAAHSGPWVALWKLDTTTRWFAALANSGATWAGFRAREKFERPGKPPLTANFASVLFWRSWTPPAAIVQRLWWSA